MKSPLVLSLSLLLASSLALHAETTGGTTPTSNADPKPALDQTPTKVAPTKAGSTSAAAPSTSAATDADPAIGTATPQGKTLPSTTTSAAVPVKKKVRPAQSTTTATSTPHVKADTTKTPVTVKKPIKPVRAESSTPRVASSAATVPSHHGITPTKVKLQARINAFPKGSVKYKKVQAFIKKWHHDHPTEAVWSVSFRLALNVELTALEVVVVRHSPVIVEPIDEAPAKELPNEYPAPRPSTEARGGQVCKCGPYPVPPVAAAQVAPIRELAHPSSYTPDRVVVEEAAATPVRRSNSDPFFSQLPGNVFANNLPYGNLPNYGLGIGQNGNGSGLPSWYPAPFNALAQNQFRNPFATQQGGYQPQLGGFQPQINNGLGFGNQFGGAPPLPANLALYNGFRPGATGFAQGPTIAPFQGGGLQSPLLGANYQQPIFSQLGNGGFGGFGGGFNSGFGGGFNSGFGGIGAGYGGGLAAAPTTLPFLGQYGGGLSVGSGIGQSYFSGAAPTITPFLGGQQAGIYNGGAAPTLQPYLRAH